MTHRRGFVSVGMVAASLAVAAVPLRAAAEGQDPEVRIPLRDGVRLAADFFVPPGSGKYPTIFEMTPYGKRGPLTFRSEAQFWVDRGYAFGLVDTRGQGNSEGEFDYFRNDGPDGAQVVEWIAAQAWSDGKVGMRGSSYTGSNQWLVAREAPPHLRCISPSAAFANPFRDPPYIGGVFGFGWALNWVSILSDAGVDPDHRNDFAKLLGTSPMETADSAAVGKPLALYRRFVAHPRYDDYWRGIVLSPADFRRIAIPSLAFSGWFDGMLPGTVDNFVNARRYSPVPDSHFLILGPWEHHSAPDGGYGADDRPIRRVGNVDIPPEGVLPAREILRQFFGWCLKGEGSFGGPHLRSYLTGSNRWLDHAQYPVPEAKPRPLYLRGNGKANGLAGDGRLDWVKPADEPADRYRYDPARPVDAFAPSDSGRGRELLNYGQDLSAKIDRPDVLVYRSAPFDEPITLLGDVKLILEISVDATDTDFMAWLEDVAPDGRAAKLGSGVVGMAGARFRRGPQREVWLVPNRPDRVTVGFSPIGHTVLAGHRLRLSISSSAYPWAHPNPNTGPTKGPPRPATITVRHDRARPSRLVLPILPSP